MGHLGMRYLAISATCALLCISSNPVFADADGYLDVGPVPDNAFFLTTQSLETFVPVSPVRHHVSKPQNLKAQDSPQTPQPVRHVELPKPIPARTPVGIELPSTPLPPKGKKSSVAKAHRQLWLAELVYRNLGLAIAAFVFAAIVCWMLIRLRMTIESFERNWSRFANWISRIGKR